jgi:hypothetical protein
MSDKQLDWKQELQQFLAEVEGVDFSYNGVFHKFETLDEGHYCTPVGVVQVSHTIH